MKRIGRYLGAAVVLAGLAMVGTGFAQRGGGGEGNWMAMMGQRMVPVESVLGFLAFDEGVNLEDGRLAKVREVLRSIVKERRDLGSAGDREAVMEQAAALNKEMAASLKTVLTASQNDALTGHLADLESRGRGWGRGGVEEVGIGGTKRTGAGERGAEGEELTGWEALS